MEKMNKSQEFDMKLRSLCDQYEVFIQSVRAHKGRPKDKVSFREYILSVKITEENNGELLIE